MCHTSAGATVTDQAEHLSHISRNRVTDQVEPECQLSGGTRHHNCRAGGTRTPDHWFWRPGLYQLSYRPIRATV